MTCYSMPLFLFVLLFKTILTSERNTYLKRKKQEMIVVTAFFGDARFSPNSSLKYFKSWGRVKNPLVVFCQNNGIKEKIMKIREGYELENETFVVVIEDIFSIEREIFSKMVEVEKNQYFQKFGAAARKRKGGREGVARYNYVTNLKSYFINRACVDCEIESSHLAWMDFGFGKGGTFTNEKDWSFRLQCETSNRITLFILRPKRPPLFEMIRTYGVPFIAGGMFICPRNLTGRLWMLVKESISFFLDFELMCPDEPVFQLASQLNPEIFHLKNCRNWNLAVRFFCNGGHLRVKNYPKTKIPKTLLSSSLTPSKPQNIKKKILKEKTKPNIPKPRRQFKITEQKGKKLTKTIV